MMGCSFRLNVPSRTAARDRQPKLAFSACQRMPVLELTLRSEYPAGHPIQKPPRRLGRESGDPDEHYFVVLFRRRVYKSKCFRIDIDNHVRIDRQRALDGGGSRFCLIGRRRTAARPRPLESPSGAAVHFA
jgi:hypothetical protein